MRELFPSTLQQIQSDSPFLLKHHFGRHMGFGSMFRIFCSGFREIELRIDQSFALRTGVGQKDSDLTVVGFPQTAAPLPSDATGLVAFFGKGTGIENEDAWWLGSFLGDVPSHFRSAGVIAPKPFTEKALQEPSELLRLDGDGLGGLAIQRSELALEDGARVLL